MTKKQKEEAKAEFGEEQGRAIIAEQESIEWHCRVNNITEHSINSDGFCNMGCC